MSAAITTVVAPAAASTFAVWLLAAAVLGLGTAMVYPTLLAAVADVATPSWRGAAVGATDCGGDLGFAAGAIVAGFWPTGPACLPRSVRSRC